MEQKIISLSRRLITVGGLAFGGFILAAVLLVLCIVRVFFSNWHHISWSDQCPKSEHANYLEKIQINQMVIVVAGGGCCLIFLILTVKSAFNLWRIKRYRQKFLEPLRTSMALITLLALLLSILMVLHFVRIYRALENLSRLYYQNRSYRKCLDKQKISQMNQSEEMLIILLAICAMIILILFVIMCCLPRLPRKPQQPKSEPIQNVKSRESTEIVIKQNPQEIVMQPQKEQNQIQWKSIGVGNSDSLESVGARSKFTETNPVQQKVMTDRAVQAVPAHQELGINTTEQLAVIKEKRDEYVFEETPYKILEMDNAAEPESPIYQEKLQFFQQKNYEPKNRSEPRFVMDPNYHNHQSQNKVELYPKYSVTKHFDIDFLDYKDEGYYYCKDSRQQISRISKHPLTQEEQEEDPHPHSTKLSNVRHQKHDYPSKFSPRHPRKFGSDHPPLYTGEYQEAEEEPEIELTNRVRQHKLKYSGTRKKRIPSNFS